MGATSKILGLFWQFDVLQCNLMGGCYKRKIGAKFTPYERSDWTRWEARGYLVVKGGKIKGWKRINSLLFKGYFDIL